MRLQAPGACRLAYPQQYSTPTFCRCARHGTITTTTPRLQMLSEELRRYKQRVGEQEGLLAARERALVALRDELARERQRLRECGAAAPGQLLQDQQFRRELEARWGAQACAGQRAGGKCHALVGCSLFARRPLLICKSTQRLGRGGASAGHAVSSWRVLALLLGSVPCLPSSASPMPSAAPCALLPAPAGTMPSASCSRRRASWRRQRWRQVWGAGRAPPTAASSSSLCARPHCGCAPTWRRAPHPVCPRCGPSLFLPPRAPAGQRPGPGAPLAGGAAPEAQAAAGGRLCGARRLLRSSAPIQDAPVLAEAFVRCRRRAAATRSCQAQRLYKVLVLAVVWRMTAWLGFWLQRPLQL